MKSKVQLNIATSILIADRSVEMEDMSGNKIRGTGLNVMKVIPDTVYSFGHLIDNLKVFLKVVNLDKEVKMNLEMLISDFSMKLTLFNKYEKVLNSLKFGKIGLGEEKCNYAKFFKEYGWIIYIICEKIMIGDSPEIPKRMYLMASVFQFLVINSADQYRSNVIDLGDCKFTRC